MSTGSATWNTIVVSPEPRGGRFLEGIASGTIYPGTIVAPGSTAWSLGRMTWAAWTTSKAPWAIVCEDSLQGRTVAQAYANGERMRLYIPVMGDELLLRCAAAAYTISQAIKISTSTGLGAAGTAPTEFISEEATTLSETDLLLVMYSGLPILLTGTA